jgi:transcriptional regulatory protein RtcR
MATFSPKGRIDADGVSKEIARLKQSWSGTGQASDGLEFLLGAETVSQVDPFDRIQLSFVVETCRSSHSLSDAGRKLFSASRERRASTNDADRLRKYLARFDLTWDAIARRKG